MATNKIWNVKYVVGNPQMFNKVITASGGPYMRAKALEDAQFVAENGGGWRVWVEHVSSGERIYESPAEIEHKKS